MTKTEEFVKRPGTTMFFPRVILTEDEMHILREGTVDPNWVRMIAINFDDFKDIWKKPRTLTAEKAYSKSVHEWSWKADIVLADLKDFSEGKIDVIDLVVKYGIHYKKCRQFVKDVLFQSGKDVDVDFYWKQHKKFAQKNTTIALYGVEHTALREEVQAKRRETNREIYDADNPMQVPEIKEKLRKRILAEHGVEYTFLKRTQVPAWYNKVFNCLNQDPLWMEILKEACDKAGAPFDSDMFDAVIPLMRRDFVISELHNTHVEDLLRLWKEKTGAVMKFPSNALFRLPFTFSKPWLRYYENKGLLEVPELYYTSLSIYEKRLEHFLNELSVPYLRNHKKTLHNLEMDFYIPDKRIGIEVNPNVSHNSNLYATEAVLSMFSSHKEPSYHYNKYKKAAEEGVTLIQLFGNDLEPSTFEQVTSKRLRSILCGYDEKFQARKIAVRETVSEQERKQARAFLEEHHSQGSSRANSYWVFESSGRWLGVASFSPFHVKGCAELKRLCFAPGVQVIGGLSKLIAHYLRKYPEYHAVYSYSDNSMGNGEAYRKAGAEFIKETGPALKFISPHDGRDSYSWQIATSWGADKGVIGMDADNKGIDKPSSQEEIDRYIETELTHRLDELKGYDRIYTPGSKLWKFTRKE